MGVGLIKRRMFLSWSRVGLFWSGWRGVLTVASVFKLSGDLVNFCACDSRVTILRDFLCFLPSTVRDSGTLLIVLLHSISYPKIAIYATTEQ